jgi:hypothetical protein
VVVVVVVVVVVSSSNSNASDFSNFQAIRGGRASIVVVSSAS